MSLTSSANIFASINDAVINALVRDLMIKRPQWFNYGDAKTAGQAGPLCVPLNVDLSIPASARVARLNLPATINAGPLGTLTVPGLNLCIQITTVQVDFAPGDAINLPPELNPPLPAQRLAVHLSCSAGLGNGAAPTPTLNCFTLDVYLIVGLHVQGSAPIDKPVALHLQPVIQNIEIAGLQPDGLRDSVRTLLTTFAQSLIDHFEAHGGIMFVQKIDLTQLNIKVNPFPAPMGPGLDNNPALEQNQLKVFVDLNVAP